MASVFQQQSIADIFENILVPSTFGPYAKELIERAGPIDASARILDLGCGTGVVARQLRDKRGSAANLVGLDVGAPMIAKARAVAPDIEWHEGNAMALPFADRSFDVVFSQQMLQFVPDRALAIREIRRVLKPGGRLIASTWRSRPEQPFFEALGQVIEKHLGAGNDKRFSLDGETLRAELLASGFTNVALETCSLVDRYREFPVRASALASSNLEGMPEAEKEAKINAVVADSDAVLAQFAVDGGYAAKSITNVVIAS